MAAARLFPAGTATEGVFLRLRRRRRCREILSSFSTFLNVFERFRMCSNLFGRIRMRSDPFGNFW